MESESDPLTRRPVDLFEKEPLKGNSEVQIHTPTKFGEDPSKDLRGDREQTDKRCSIYSMIRAIFYIIDDVLVTVSCFTTKDNSTAVWMAWKLMVE